MLYTCVHTALPPPCPSYRHSRRVSTQPVAAAAAAATRSLTGGTMKSQMPTCPRLAFFQKVQSKRLYTRQKPNRESAQYSTVQNCTVGRHSRHLLFSFVKVPNTGLSRLVKWEDVQWDLCRRHTAGSGAVSPKGTG